MVWHELGCFYAIKSESTPFYYYNNSGVVNGGSIMAFIKSGNNSCTVDEDDMNTYI